MAQTAQESVNKFSDKYSEYIKRLEQKREQDMIKLKTRNVEPSHNKMISFGGADTA